MRAIRPPPVPGYTRHRAHAPDPRLPPAAGRSRRTATRTAPLPEIPPLTLPGFAIVLVLLAALSHACWNALVKISGDRLVIIAAVNLVGAAIALLALPFVDVPRAEAWPWLITSVLVHLLYYYFLIAQYRAGDLSHVYPLSRGLSPLLVAGAAALLAGEVLPAAAMAGIALSSAGIASLAFEGGPPWRRDAAPALFACGTAVVIALYTVVDGIGVRRAGSAPGYIAWLFVLDGLPVALFAAARRRRELGRILAREWPRSVLGGALALLAYGLVIWALSLGPMAHVSALRETSVIFAALIGVLALRERFGPRRVLAAVLVSAGLVLLHAGR